jgi:hypothetical protein
MKNRFLAPLCSAFVIPGLGQIINQQLKKGVCILATVFLLFVITTLKLYSILKDVSLQSSIDPTDSNLMMAHLRGQNLSLIWILAAIFAVIWLYSIVDALLGSFRRDRRRTVLDR